MWYPKCSRLWNKLIFRIPTFTGKKSVLRYVNHPVYSFHPNNFFHPTRTYRKILKKILKKHSRHSFRPFLHNILCQRRKTNEDHLLYHAVHRFPLCCIIRVSVHEVKCKMEKSPSLSPKSLIHSISYKRWTRGPWLGMASIFSSPTRPINVCGSKRPQSIMIDHRIAFGILSHTLRTLSVVCYCMGNKGLRNVRGRWWSNI